MYEDHMAWEAKIKGQRALLEHFIGWLRTKQQDGTYDWEDMKGNCLIGQYGASFGMSWHQTSSEGGLYTHLQETGFNSHRRPWTYNNALRQAEDLLEELA